MSTMVLLKVRDTQGIGGGPKALLIALADLSGLDGECQTTIERLARYTDTDPETVTRDLTALCEADLVKAEPTPGGAYQFKVRAG